LIEEFIVAIASLCIAYLYTRVKTPIAHEAIRWGVAAEMGPDNERG
jgi:hypothetical protein